MDAGHPVANPPGTFSGPRRIRAVSKGMNRRPEDVIAWNRPVSRTLTPAGTEKNAKNDRDKMIEERNSPARG